MDIRQVPVVDIETLMAFSTDAEVDAALRNANDGALGKTIEEIRAAASEWGFFYITHHGLSEQEVAKFQEAMRSFFRLPKEIKRTVRRTPTNSRGYVEHELTKNKVDCKECFDFAGATEDGPTNDEHQCLGSDENQWVKEEYLPGFHNEMSTYFGKMEYIARRLLKVFAVALDEEPAFFDQFFYGDNSNHMRLNHYPATDDPEKTMGVYHHTDAGALTILLQDDDVASLQVFHRDSQTWTNVPPRKGTYTINIGDMVQVWSNDRFVAPLHRVLANGGADRFSAPFFYNPSYKAQVEPIVVKAGDVANYRALSWGEFRLRRYQGNVADKGKEIQIGDFKVHGPIDVANS
ncbi:2OG-Fe(II) oxygenase superfamily protein [Phytophthora palmivora]|uniref:2OG-Fe(II) oxygenase superfamily protein n=1 Tax=Phytophthora palmivora TaxID=4796 RepID=A0A2P4YFY2_9STRA|nr:2OG-Fe(II) oxygenase superfamily protein [Phytophthora palmivora]